MSRIKVAVSPFYGGESWTDELTNITFTKNPRGLNVYSIPEDLDLRNIKKAIQLNALILVEGNVADFNEVKEIEVEAPKVSIQDTVEKTKTEAPEEEPKEEVVEEKKEKPKKKTTKKKTAKKTE